MKQKIRLNEAQLQRVIKECVRNILSEGLFSKKQQIPNTDADFISVRQALNRQELYLMQSDSNKEQFVIKDNDGNYYVNYQNNQPILYNVYSIDNTRYVQNGAYIIKNAESIKDSINKCIEFRRKREIDRKQSEQWSKDYNDSLERELQQQHTDLRTKNNSYQTAGFHPLGESKRKSKVNK